MEQGVMEMVRVADEVANREVGARAGRDGLQCVVDERAFFNAVASEGREVLGPEGRGYWEDQRRRYPHLRGGRAVEGDSLNGRYNRLGRVSLRWRGGRWYRWVGGEWVAEGGQGNV